MANKFVEFIRQATNDDGNETPIYIKTDIVRYISNMFDDMGFTEKHNYTFTVPGIEYREIRIIMYGPKFFKYPNTYELNGAEADEFLLCCEVFNEVVTDVEDALEKIKKQRKHQKSANNCYVSFVLNDYSVYIIELLDHIFAETMFAHKELLPNQSIIVEYRYMMEDGLNVLFRFRKKNA